MDLVFECSCGTVVVACAELAPEIRDFLAGFATLGTSANIHSFGFQPKRSTQSSVLLREQDKLVQFGRPGTCGYRR